MGKHPGSYPSEFRHMIIELIGLLGQMRLMPEEADKAAEPWLRRAGGFYARLSRRPWPNRDRTCR